MPSILFIQDLAIVMIAAALVSLMFVRFNQPRVVGYILAGLIVGPHTPPFSFIHDEASIRTLADLGVIFLMFSLGLEFNFRKLRGVGRTALFVAGLDVMIMVWVGFTLGRVLGWGRLESFFLGVIVCDSSTTILAKVIGDLGWARRRFAELVFGITLVEDLLAIVLIAVLNGVVVSGALEAGPVAGRIGELGVFLVTVVILGLLVVPRLLGALARYKNDELLLITVLGLCFGVSLVAVKLDFSLALGAFLIGAVTAEARSIARIEQLVAPLRHMFSAVFFVTVGLMIQPNLMMEHGAPILFIALAVLAAKTINNAAGALLAGQSPGDSFRVGLGMAQIGEMAYIVAAMGVAMGMTRPFLYQVAVAVSLITTVLNPYLLRGSGALAAALKRRVNPAWMDRIDLYHDWLDRMSAQQADSALARVVRRSVWILLVNAALIAAIFLAGAFLAGYKDRLLPALALRAGTGDILIWLACAALALPLLAATIQKLRALGMILSEVCVPPALVYLWAPPLRALIAHVFLLLGLLGLGLMTFALSSTLLPSWKEQALLLAAMGFVMWGRWKRLGAVYAGAQSSLRALFARQTAPEAAVSSLLSVHMETVVIAPQSAGAGRRIVDLQLRAQTGANAVSIERGGQTLVNPAPSEVLRPGDRVLLLGYPDQLEKAARLIG